MIALSDGQYQIIPDQFTLLIAAVGLLSRLSHPLSLFTSVLPAILITTGLPWLVGFLWSKWRNQEALGMGDIKLLFAFSLVFGWPMAGFVLFTGIMLAGLYFALLLLLRKLQLSDHSPLGPFLSLAAAAWLLCSTYLMQGVLWYLALF
jgi:prepilin signal peptidase PulO-like enzyme (type II secretory pathway)